MFGPKRAPYERSRSIRRWVLREISARSFLYFPKHPKLSKKLKNEEADLIGKKNDMSIEEYKKYADALRAKVVEYQKQRKEVFL